MRSLNTFLMLICLIFLISANVFAADAGFSSRREIKEFCQMVVTYVKDGKIGFGFELIRQQWLFPMSEIDSIQEQTTGQLSGVTGRFGNPFSTAFIREEQVSDVVVRYTYVVLYDKHLIRWIFTFYRPRDRWLLNSFKWDDTIDELF